LTFFVFFRQFGYRKYYLATMLSITDRRTDKITTDRRQYDANMTVRSATNLTK